MFVLVCFIFFFFFKHKTAYEMRISDWSSVVCSSDPETLIGKKSGKFDASDYHNHYVDAIKRVIAKKAKAKGKRVLEDVEEPGPVSGGSNVIDLMAALKASVDGKKKTAASDTKKAPAKKTPAKKTAERKRA